MEIHKDPWTLSGFRLELPAALGYPFSHIGEYLIAKDMTLDLHVHDTWELLLQVNGSTSWTYAKQQITVRESELLICPPGLKHGKSTREAADFRFYFLGCKMDPERWPELKRYLPTDRMSKLPHALDLARYFRIIEEELLFDQPLQKEGVILGWKQFWLAVHRLAASDQRVWNREEKWLVQRVSTLVEARPGERWTLQTMARLMGYAPNYFAGLFKRESGWSFHQFVINARIEAAKHALEMAEETATEIALRLGFSSSQHFSRVFAEKTQVTPSQWAGRARRAGTRPIALKKRIVEA
jgi:AraC family transcriptional regulator